MNRNEIENRLRELNPEERKAAFQILQDVANGNDSSLNALISADYRELPVSPEQFLADPYYFKHIGDKCYPIWRKNFCEMYAEGNYVFCVILTGSIGCGKDFYVQLCNSYDLYKLGCLKNPHAFYNMAPNSDIVTAMVSVTQKQTKAVLFNGFKSMIDMSPWFKDHFRRNMDKNDTIEINSPIDDGHSAEMGKIITMYGAPSNATVLGANVLTAIIDEANFMEVIQKSKKVRGVNKEFNQAKILYNNLFSRMDSRFHKLGGRLAGKLFVMSSRQYPDDFVEEKIQQLRGREGVVIYEYTKYQVDPDNYSKTTFKLELGDARFPPRLLEVGDEQRPGSEVIEIPDDLKQQFLDDPDLAIRNVAGRATLSVQNFLGQRDRLYSCVSPLVPCFFSAQRTTLEDGHCILEDRLKGIDLTIPRSIHLDLSRNDCSTGFAMSHISGIKAVEHSVETSVDDLIKHTKVKEYLPVFRTDLMLEIIAPVNKNISQAKIRSLIMKLRDLGFNIVIVTADDYQSDATLETLATNGFTTGKQSVDKSLDPYYNLRTAIYEYRYECYKHEKFFEEMINLEENYKLHKIEKRMSGGSSKDVSDAVAGSIQNLIDLGIMSSSVLLKEQPSFGLVEEDPTSVTKEEVQEEFDNATFTEAMGVVVSKG